MRNIYFFELDNNILIICKGENGMNFPYREIDVFTNGYRKMALFRLLANQNGGRSHWRFKAAHSHCVHGFSET